MKENFVLKIVNGIHMVHGVRAQEAVVLARKEEVGLVFRKNMEVHHVKEVLLKLHRVIEDVVL